MVRWFKRRALSKEDFSVGRTWFIVFAILNLANAAITISEYQPENRVPLSAWGSMTISVFSVLTAVYYQRRLDQARAIAGVMRDSHQAIGSASRPKAGSDDNAEGEA